MSSSTTRPVRTVRPSNKLNKDNIAELVLPSHRKFVETAQAPSAPSSESPSPEPPSSTIISADAALTPHSEPGPSNPGKRRPRITDSLKPRYAPFVPALKAAMEKLNEYYKRTAESDAHIIAMGSHFHIHILMNHIMLTHCIY